MANQEVDFWPLQPGSHRSPRCACCALRCVSNRPVHRCVQFFGVQRSTRPVVPAGTIYRDILRTEERDSFPWPGRWFVRTNKVVARGTPNCGNDLWVHHATVASVALRDGCYVYGWFSTPTDLSVRPTTSSMRCTFGESLVVNVSYRNAIEASRTYWRRADLMWQPAYDTSPARTHRCIFRRC